MLRILLSILIYFMICGAHAGSTAPLPVLDAFALTGYMDQNKQLVLQWDAAPDYYLYRSSLSFKPTDKNEVKLGKIVLPPGEKRHDDLHGDFQAYPGMLIVRIPVLAPKMGRLNINITYQGCSSKGFCYPPVKQNLNVNLEVINGPTDLTDNIVSLGSHATHAKVAVSEQSRITALLMGHHYFLIIGSFLILGLLLAFTPCVLPMIPILSSIIVGYSKNITTRKAFSLSLAYVLGMALAYAAAGVFIAWAGGSVQMALQTPWVITLFSILFVLLALSLFGLYEFKLPNKLHQKVAALSYKHQGGTYASVFLMGAFSTLVVSPCVSAPLVGVLTYIAQSGDMVLGGCALLALGIGMGIPLLLIGTSAGKFLPRSGAWMDSIKQLFGLLMLALAIWMLSRIVAPLVILLLWAVLAFITAVFIWKWKHSNKVWRKFHQAMGLALLSYGFILLGGAVSGSTDPLHPLNHFGLPLVSTQKLQFTIVKDMNDLNQQLAQAQQHKKAVLLDFYADWCVSCVAMDAHVFSEAQVYHALQQFVLLRADITQNNEFDKMLLKRFDVIAPPTIIFFDKAGEQLPKKEIVGEVEAKEFLSDLQKVGVNQKI